MSKILFENKNQKPKRRSKKFWIVFSLILGLILAGIGAFYVYGKQIFTENFSASAPALRGGDVSLKSEGDGRINILFLGYGGSGHQGSYLTDTIQILSIDAENKSMAMLSIPRDLYVEVKLPSYAGKINTLYDLGNKQTKEGGANLVKQEIGKILDLPIHYYVGLDFNGFKKAVDSVGGIDINVPKALYDPNYPADDMIRYQTVDIKAVQQHMNGETALKYARSRETTSDFDRSARQQLVASAFKAKVMSTGVLASPSKVVLLMNAITSNVRTDLTINEIQQLSKIAKDIDSSKVATEVLDDSAEGPFYSDSSSGTYYLKPKNGSWTKTRQIVHKLFSDPYLVKEDAKVEIINASGKSSIGSDLSNVLKSYGYNIVKVTTASQTQNQSAIYDFSNGEKKFTLQFLSNRIGVSVNKKTKPSGSTLDIQIIIGKDYKETYAQKG